MSEFKLSDKIWNDGEEGCHNMYYEEDVKEFIRLLKEAWWSGIPKYLWFEKIDELTGDLK